MSKRNQLLKLIHVGKRELKLGDDQYRALLQGASAGGADSCRDMSLPQLQAALRIMQQKGFKPSRRSSKRTSGPLSKVWALWFELKRLGAIRVASKKTLTAFVKRQTGLEELDLINDNPKEAAQLIETLKSMVGRHGSST